MSSDRIGKYRERASRSHTPYTRPKGIIRRVTDSVSGLLSGSWIPGFLRAEEQVEDSDAPEQNHQPQPGPSNYRPQQKHASSSSRTFAAIYPEEAGDDVCISSGYWEPASAPAAATQSQVTESGNLEAVNAPRIFPESSLRESSEEEQSTQQQQQHYSTPPSSHTAAHSQYNAVSSPLQYSSSSTPQQPYSGTSKQYSSPSTSSQRHSQYAATNTPQKSSAQRQRHHQQSSLHEYSEHEQQKEDTVKSTRNAASQFTQGGSSSSSVSDIASTPSARLRSAQVLSSKRPRFSLAAYNAAATPVGDKSVLSDSSFRSSPFYPGRTIYGGAAAYRRTPTPVTPNRSATASPRIGGTGSDAGLSDAAQRILSCLNAMSTPLTDAKRIPTPAASPYVSYLDSPYTAAFHKHKPHRPPTAALSTPAKVGIQSNLSQYVLPNRGSTNNSSQPLSSSNSKADHSVLDPAASSPSTGAQQPSIFSVAAASATRSSGGAAASLGASQLASGSSAGGSNNNNPLLQPSKPLVLSTSPARLPAIAEADNNHDAAAASTSAAVNTPMFSFGASNSSTEGAAGGGGKIKSTKLNSQNRQSRSNIQNSDWELSSVPALPNVTLPKLNFTTPISLSTLGAKKIYHPPTIPGYTATELQRTTTSSQSLSKSNVQASDAAPLDAFKFSVPEVIQRGSEINNAETTMPQFRFSLPSSVLPQENSTDNFAVPNSSFVPKVKSPSPVKKSSSINSTRELITKPGGLLEFLSKSSDASNSNNDKDNSIQNNCMLKDSDNFKSCWGDKFKAASGSWECGTCLVRNKAEDGKCLACETAKPGESSTQLASLSGATSNNNNNNSKNISTVKTTTSSGFGDVFKKAGKDWDCDACLLRNKENADACIACQAPKPGAKSSSSAPSNSSSFSFGVQPVSLTAVTTTTAAAFSFGVPSTSVASNNSTTSTTPSGFSVGGKHASSSSNFNFGVTASTSTSTATVTPATSVGNSKDIAKNSLLNCNTTENGFGAAFKKASGSWECSTCLVNNKSSARNCVACDAVKPGNNGEKVTTTVLNNNNNKVYDKPILQGFGDKFKKSEGDWECETCLVSNKSATVKCLACETPKPGSTSTSSSSKLLTGNFKFGNADQPSDSSFKFGVSESSDKSSLSDANNAGASGFQFGAPSSAAAEAPAQFSFGVKPSSSEGEKTNFSFGVKPSVTSNGDHSFGSVITTKTAANEQTSSITTTSSFSFTSPSNQSPVLKTKYVEKASNKTLELKKGNVLDFLNAVSDDSQKTSKEKLVSKIPFGTNSINKSSDSGSSGSTFNFGSADSSPKPKFSFGNSSTDTSKKVQTFFQNNTNATPNDSHATTKTSNKRSLTEDDTPSKKSNNLFGKNNGIADNNSLFSFSKPMGSTDSAAAANSMFTFSTIDSKASSVFGGGGATVPAFGSQDASFTNNNTITDTIKPVAGAKSTTFAFGQPPEKKPSASFDFGQAAAPSPTFNFAATAPSFHQFVQTNASSGSSAPSNNGSIFQFGSGPAPPTSVSPSFGSGPANPFSQTPSATPPGRVVKRAIRRTKK